MDSNQLLSILAIIIVLLLIWYVWQQSQSQSFTAKSGLSYHGTSGVAPVKVEVPPTYARAFYGSNLK